MSKKFEQLDDAVKVLLWHLPWDESEKNQPKLLSPEKGPYFYFRRSKSPLHERLTQLIDYRSIPNVFIHGSAHIDNYAKTQFAAGMVDFDRAYLGPYVWDIVCVLMAIHLRNPKHFHKALNKDISEQFQQEYIHHFKHPELNYKTFAPLDKVNVKSWEENIHNYLKSGKKWAKQLSSENLSDNDPFATSLLEEFIHHHPLKDSFKNYKIKTVAFGNGSFGRKRYLYILEKKKSGPVIIDIKQTKNYSAMPWNFMKWYRNPFTTDGQRLLEACKYYAPKFAEKESYALVNGVDYWGREVPILNRKPDKLFDKDKQIAFAVSAGSQLGRGHRLSLYEIEQDDFLKQFTQLMPEVVKITNVLLEETMAMWEEYVKRYGDT